MYNDKRRKKKKLILIIIGSVAIFLLLVYLLKDDDRMTKVEGYLKDVVINIEEVFLRPFLPKETEVTSCADDVEREALKRDLQELTNLLELKEHITDYDMINAVILSRSPDYWFQTLTIDRGSKDGIEKDMVVTTNLGLIGKIRAVSKSTSEVELITSNSENDLISVEILGENTVIPAILSGYDAVDQNVIVTGIDQHLHVEIGQDVITSGLGGVFPRGIYVGQVVMVENEKYDISKKLKVRLLQDFNDLHYVSVLKRKDL